MNNKVHVIIYVPLIEKKYEVLIPINRKLGTIIHYLSKSINELSGGYYPIKENTILCDKINGIKYDHTLLLKDTNIRNGKEVVLI